MGLARGWAAMLAAAATLALGGCVFAPDIPYETLETRYTSPASRFAELKPGLRVHYRDQGRADGQPLVLVHGFAASLHAWEPWVGELGDRYRIITLDLPQQGLTRTPEGYRLDPADQVEVVDALTRRLGVERFALGGNSMGAGVAWRYALAHPDRVQALVLVDGSGPRLAAEPTREGQPLAFRLLANPAGRAALRRVDPALVAERSLASAYVDKRLVTPELVRRYSELARAPGRRAALTSGGRGPPQAPPAELFQRIRAPTLVMHGEADTVIGLPSGRALAAAIPGARLIVYPGVGHVPMEQIPARSAKDADAFLAAAIPKPEPGP